MMSSVQQLCYAMLCYAMLCYAMSCYAMLCYAMKGEEDLGIAEVLRSSQGSSSVDLGAELLGRRRALKVVDFVVGSLRGCVHEPSVRAALGEDVKHEGGGQQLGARWGDVVAGEG